MNILKATHSHFNVIREIAYKTWPVAYVDLLSVEQIRYMLELMYNEKELQELQHEFILAEESNKYLAFASYELNFCKLTTTKIHKIYVLPEDQGQGVGYSLIQKIEEISKKNGDKKLLLNVNRFNNKAIRFYNRFGFEIVSEENIEIGNGFIMEDYIMIKVFHNNS